MNEATEEILKRAFAEAPVVGADEGFVVSLAVDVAGRRRARRMRRMAIWMLACACAVLLAWLLAPLALTASVSTLGNTLLGLPDRIGAQAVSAGNLRYVVLAGLALAGLALPLVAAAWLARRV
jgi:hypothetical protein